MNAGLDGRPDIELDWDSVASYLDRFDRGMGVNVAFLVGNSALRLGTTGWDEVEASRADQASMAAMLREAMQDGAYGLSSGLDYPPGSYATTAELANLAAEAAKLGGLLPHARALHARRPVPRPVPRGDRHRAAGRAPPAHITHFYHRATFPGTPDQMLELVDDARAEGLDVTFDAYPYEWASTRLLITVPPWVQAGGPGPTKERLADPAMRDADPRRARGPGRPLRGRGRARRHPARLLRAPGEPPVRGPDAGRRGAGARRRPRRRAVRPAARRGPAAEPGHARTAHRRDPALLPAPIARWSARIPPSSAPSRAPRSYGSYPRILGQFVRDEALLSLEAAVAKMTSMPAARLGLKDRGPNRRRLGRGPRRVRPGDRPLERHVRRAAPVPRRHRPRARQRHSRRRGWRAHRRDAGARAPPRPRLTRGPAKRPRGRTRPRRA